MEEAARARGLEVAGLQVLLQVAREEADYHRLESNRQRAAADEWRQSAKTAEGLVARSVELTDELRAALAAAETRIKQLERQTRRRLSSSLSDCHAK